MMRDPDQRPTQGPSWMSILTPSVPPPSAMALSARDKLRKSVPEGFLSVGALQDQGLFATQAEELIFWRDLTTALGKALRKPGVSAANTIATIRVGSEEEGLTLTLFYAGDDSNKIRYAIRVEDVAALKAASRQLGKVQVTVLERTTYQVPATEAAILR